MQKFFIYARESSEAEDRQILSIESQIIELKRFATEKGIKIIDVLTEAKSSKDPGVRPIFNSMMERLYRGEADGVLCWKLDRLARNPVDGGAIIWAMKQKNLTIITPLQTFNQNEDNVVWMYLEFGMAQKYVDDLSRNVKRGLKTKAESGWFPGTVPPGYQNRTNPDGRRTIARDPKRFPLIRKCWELMLTGKYTPADIWEMSNTVLGFRTTNGLPMTRSTIYRILRSRFYSGTYEYPRNSGIWHNGRHTPMVTGEEFNQVQTLMIRGRKWPKNRKVFPFTGLIRCGSCEHMVTAEEKHQLICPGCSFKFANKHKTQCPKCKLAIEEMKSPKKLLYTYYHCTGKGKFCSEPSIKGEELLSQVVGILESTRLPLRHEHWMQGRILSGSSKGSIASLLKKALLEGSAEIQRKIVVSVTRDLRLKNRRLSFNFQVPFEFKTSPIFNEDAFSYQTLNEEMTRA